jgi:RNA polymerase sigma-70 factor (ECF subfamily)
VTTEAPAGTAAFVRHRALLFTVAYEMLGSAADAEDVVQETWLRWADVAHDEVRDPRAYLVRVTTRLALNRLRTLSRRRESYVGPWLPEPLLTSPDVADDVELADSVSTAMLLVLETLAPTERAVFVLREVFDVPYDEIATAVGKSPEAVRQVAHRARSHVQARRPRQEVTGPSRTGSSSGSSRRRRPATCSRCSTCCRPMSCWSPTAAATRRPRSGRSSAATRRCAS